MSKQEIGPREQQLREMRENRFRLLENETSDGLKRRADAEISRLRKKVAEVPPKKPKKAKRR